jgi:hypothetical protein
MASVSSVSGLSSLAEDLYYQYLINNNSTSTMLNALSGTSDSDSDTSGLMSAVSSGLSSSLSGVTGLESLSSLLGSSDSDDSLLETSQALSNFSDILQVYMNAQTTEAATMADSLSSVLEEAAQTEDTSSLSYRTVQEIYQYFLDKSSSADQGTSSVTSQLQDASSATDSSSYVSTDTSGQVTELDFDSLEEQLQQEAESQVVVPF